VLVTEVVHPLALQFKKYFENHLGVHGVISTELEIHHGIYTGRATRLCRGEEKAFGVEQYAHKHDIDLTKSYGYGDATSDAFMLEVVGHPTAVKPGRTMRRLAHQKHWTILE
jgi:phosphoserine phosphatase